MPGEQVGMLTVQDNICLLESFGCFKHTENVHAVHNIHTKERVSTLNIASLSFKVELRCITADDHQVSVTNCET